VGKKDKLIARLKSKPKDFTFAEMESLLECLGYERNDKGRTSGSRIAFKNSKHKTIVMHKPHPRKELLEYQVKEIIKTLDEEGLL